MKKTLKSSFLTLILAPVAAVAIFSNTALAQDTASCVLDLHKFVQEHVEYSEDFGGDIEYVDLAKVTSGVPCGLKLNMSMTQVTQVLGEPAYNIDYDLSDTYHYALYKDDGEIIKGYLQVNFNSSRLTSLFNENYTEN